MDFDLQSQFRYLAGRIVEEKDPQIFDRLCGDLSKLLAEHEQRMHEQRVKEQRSKPSEGNLPIHKE